MANIPQTIARMKYAASIYTAGSYVRTGLNDPINYDISKMTKLGSITGLSYTSSRTTRVWRQLDFETGGLPVEVVPSLPEYSIKVKKIQLYNNPNPKTTGAIEADTVYSTFNLTDNGHGGFDVIDQIKPLIIAATFHSPTQNNNVVAGYAAPVTILFLGVWFEGLTFDYDSEDENVLVAQDVDGKFASMIKG